MLKMAVLRRELKLSQNALAQRARLHPSTISAIEAGRMRPWPGQATRIAEALGVACDQVDDVFAEEAGDER